MSLPCLDSNTTSPFVLVESHLFVERTHRRPPGRGALDGRSVHATSTTLRLTIPDGPAETEAQTPVAGAQSYCPVGPRHRNGESSPATREGWRDGKRVPETINPPNATHRTPTPTKVGTHHQPTGSPEQSPLTGIRNRTERTANHGSLVVTL